MKQFVTLLLFLLPSVSNASCSGNQKQLSIQITPDRYPTETSWSLYDAQTGVLIDTGNVGGANICVDANRCIEFTIFDTHGDGICCANGQGSYTVTLDGTTVTTGGRFSLSESTIFNCPAGFFCSNPYIATVDTMVAPKPESWYLFVPDSSGLYSINTCGLNNTCQPVLYVYDQCGHLVIYNNNLGSILYNYNGCGQQAYISAALPAGKPYYIRIGQLDTACKALPIRWQIQFTGAIKGCTDSTSCIYNPLATISDTCLYTPDKRCPLPDLTVDEGVLRQTLYTDSIFVSNGDCSVLEGCVSGYGKRQLIRLGTVTKNIGDADYYIGVPNDSNDLFFYSACHHHWHYIGYTEYLLINKNGQQVQTGFKNGFCVEDLSCDVLQNGKFNCNTMGLSSGCSDAYTPDLPCQWMDVTDVDTGYYTMLLGVNFLHHPDALGHDERTYSNNWAQANIHIYYNQTGLKIFDTLPEYTRYTDCAGDTFGTAQKDCNGVCNGPALTGNIDGNNVRDSADLLLYLDGITNETLTATPCNDINGDGRLTVGDAARLNACLRYNAGTITIYADAQTGQHLCQFPYLVKNMLDTVTFSINNVNWQNHYVDISVLSPSSNILAYEINLQGITIDSVANLYPVLYSPSIRFTPAGHIVELSNENTSLLRQYSTLPFLRIYFSAVQDSNICITEITDVLNENYEQVFGTTGRRCSQQTNTGTSDLGEQTFSIVPNPSFGSFDIYFSEEQAPLTSILIFNEIGEMVHRETGTGKRPGKIHIELLNLSGGIYFVQINTNTSSVTRRLVLLKQ